MVVACASVVNDAETPYHRETNATVLGEATCKRAITRVLVAMTDSMLRYSSLIAKWLYSPVLWSSITSFVLTLGLDQLRQSSLHGKREREKVHTEFYETELKQSFSKTIQQNPKEPNSPKRVSHLRDSLNLVPRFSSRDSWQPASKASARMSLERERGRRLITKISHGDSEEGNARNAGHSRVFRLDPSVTGRILGDVILVEDVTGFPETLPLCEKPGNNGFGSRNQRCW
ncbi:hypothetical protein WN51_08779 [Melipona quadrifasciata]|uniref:Uncharacterized protein n=1 Tax=Melipona quadrifasciata TaxID=166423 RepID=A0A0M8ZMW2_9HYME|nr:hypothetical protein WN51_08779 [Melipona quadrifasciata]